ncbi:DUF4351 domain-containing protein [Sorangium sp. So ce117]|uniref:DUF4351 domain-containing protein n=1 Tax=Sorangium sp. So ce117 TaxID=3133277 RepID=UPI003F63DCA3
MTDKAEAARRPELGVLSALAHGAGELGANIAAAVLPAIRELDEDRARFYGDLVLNSLDDTARRALEAMVKGYEYQSDFAKKYVAQGRHEGERAILLRQLRARFGELPEAAVARVEGAEIAVLEQWAERVLSAKTLAEVLDEPS